MFAIRPCHHLGPLLAGAAVLAVPVQHGFGQELGAIDGRVVTTIAVGAAQAVPGATLRLVELDQVRTSDERGRFIFEAVPTGRRELWVEVFGCAVGAQIVDVRGGKVTQADFVIERPALQVPGLTATAPGGGEETPFTVERLDLAGREGRSDREIADLIRGAFPGARVVQGSGLPGGEISIQFRGPTSLSGPQQPLIVVDGAMTAGGLSDLNSRDIRSITVLKGAVASAQYGSRGQAGVIEITTTRGADEAAAPGPLVLMDGEVSTHGLATVDPLDVTEMEMLTGAAAAVLLGVAGVERGVLRMRTSTGASAGHGLPAHCAE